METNNMYGPKTTFNLYLNYPSKFVYAQYEYVIIRIPKVNVTQFFLFFGKYLIYIVCQFYL